MMETILLTILSAAINGICLAIAFYIAFTKGIRKTIKIIIEEIEKTLKEKEITQTILASLLTKTDPPKPKEITLLNEE